MSENTPQIKYDVFVSFRGKDIRRGFLSHLVEAFCQKQIHAFVDDKLERGDKISSSLFGAIEGSFISLIILSKDYASSRWCLEELVQIVACKEKYGQILIPVFYNIDPTDVRHQRGSYEDALAEHEEKYDLTRVQTWRRALKKIANLSGIKSSDFQNDAELLEEIIILVLMRLSKHTVDSKGLVGIDKLIAHLESMLQRESKDVRVIGIWGMGGIGKTTIAQEVFNKLYAEYDRCCFLANVREDSRRHGIISLKEKLFSSMLQEDVKIKTPNGMSSYIKRMIGRMKVFIVLDDVNDSEELEKLFGTPDWYGSGSRIIVTTRDKQVLIANKVNEIYHVGLWSSCEAFQLFNLNSFSQSHHELEFYELSKMVVNYAKGIPLVLKVLSHLLRGKDKEVWKSELEKLKRIPSKKVHDVMKLSYDDLDREEQKILLDLACFCSRENMKVDSIKNLLRDCESDNSVVVGLERLKDKALITISDDNVVSMHNIIQEMAWEIVRQESSDDLGNRSRLWDPTEIYDVLKNDKGTKAIRSITTPLSTLENLKLSPDTFVKMSKLHFLNFDSKYVLQCWDFLPQGLQSLPNELRYLRWMYYPLTCLPEQFSAEKLVILDLSCSLVEKLWHGVKNLVNLKNVKLRWCKFLKELPDFSKSTNLEVLDVSCCEELTSVHPSIFFLDKLEKFDLSGCSSLIKLSSNDANLSSLRYLDLSDCEELRELSVTTENVIELDLTGTCMVTLSSSFGNQRKLEILHLLRSDIESLPACIKNLTRLRYLDLSCCSKLFILPKLPPSLETLHTDDCESLETVLFPSMAVEQFKENRKRVEFWNCLKLDELSLMAIELNSQINVMKFAYQHLSAPKLDYVENYNDYNDLHDSYQAVYMYPGSSVPEWLAYKTAKDYIIIDLSSAPPSVLGFILCFILDMNKQKFLGPTLQFNITISNGENECEKDSVEIHTYGSYSMIYSDHVCVIYDKRCSYYLNNRAKSLPKFKIKVAWLTNDQQWEVLKGFGVNPINTSGYHNFVQKMELCDQGFRPLLKITPKKRKR